jgi:hypothetical protein
MKDKFDEVDEGGAIDGAVEAIYERSERYGEPEDSFSRIAQLWSGYVKEDLDAKDVSNMMILLKVARNAEGYYHGDNYDDIVGYAEHGKRLHEE